MPFAHGMPPDQPPALPAPPEQWTGCATASCCALKPQEGEGFRLALTSGLVVLMAQPRDGTAVDESASHVSNGGVAAHHDVEVAALLEARIEDHLAGRASPRVSTLENQALPTNS